MSDQDVPVSWQSFDPDEPSKLEPAAKIRDDKGLRVLVVMATVLKGIPPILIFVAAFANLFSSDSRVEAGPTAAMLLLPAVAVVPLVAQAVAVARRRWSRLLVAAGLLLALDLIFTLFVVSWWIIEATNDSTGDDSPFGTLLPLFFNLGIQGVIVWRASMMRDRYRKNEPVLEV